MYRVCFIDDDENFEIPLFESTFGDVYDVVAEGSYGAARGKMSERGQWRPDLFVLDLYFPSGEPDRDAVDSLRQTAVTFDCDGAEMRAAYTNYLRAQSRLTAVLGAWKQGPDGGLEIARRAARDYPLIPIVFYSRKATFEDAVRCLAAEGVWWLEKKPTGDSDGATRRLTLAEKPRIVERFDAIIARRDEEETMAIKRSAGSVREFVRSMLGGDLRAENPQRQAGTLSNC
jgi:CheY-like chemotaxis protein